jgi:hypothetical protein
MPTNSSVMKLTKLEKAMTIEKTKSVKNGGIIELIVPN